MFWNATPWAAFSPECGLATSRAASSLPLARALGGHALKPASVLFVTDTASGLEQGRRLGVNPILMMNDPDEAMRLTAHQPAGGIVSLHELPDLVRFVAAENARLAAKTTS